VGLKSDLRDEYKNHPERAARYVSFEEALQMKNKFDFINDSFKLEVVSAVIPIPLLPINSKLKILHLSDFHFGGNNNYAYFQFVLAEVEKEVYDFVFFTGDLVDNVSFLRWVVPLLKKIQTKHGKFAVLGNHDLWNSPDMVRKYLRNHVGESSSKYFRIVVQQSTAKVSERANRISSE
jgi:predicted MPP superfamily phosphohydrolase